MVTIDTNVHSNCKFMYINIHYCLYLNGQVGLMNGEEATDECETSDENDDVDDDDDEGFGDGLGVKRKADTPLLLQKRAEGVARARGGGRRGKRRRLSNGWSRSKSKGQQGGQECQRTSRGNDDNTCVMCLRIYRCNEEWIKCNACTRWMHRHCGGVDNEDWHGYVINGRRPFTCPRCRSDDTPTGLRLPFDAVTGKCIV